LTIGAVSYVLGIGLAACAGEILCDISVGGIGGVVAIEAIGALRLPGLEGAGNRAAAWDWVFLPLESEECVLYSVGC